MAKTTDIKAPHEVETREGYRGIAWEVRWDNIATISTFFGGSLVKGGSNEAYRPIAIHMSLPGHNSEGIFVGIGEFVVWREEAGFGVMRPSEYNLNYS